MRAITVWALLTAGVAMLAAQAQQPAQPPQPIRVGTNFVRVDAYPTRNGQIVDGLQAADFEVLEEGVAQKIETFEHVVALRGPQTARVEPNNQRDMMRALTNPRSRVFLVFLDGAFVDDQSARSINAPLVKFLTTQLGDDDLVGLMTPTMSAKEVTYGRKLDVLAGGLPTQWLSWGRQDRQLDPVLDKKEIQYTLCYPGMSDVPGKMIARSRERKTLESLQDAVRYLASVREERKAIVAVTEGWVLYREDRTLMEPRKDEAPLGVDKIRVGPTGQLTLEDTKTSVNALSPAACAGDRAYLAGIDNDKFLRDIIDDANRGNSTFYIIDPGGLKVKGADRNGAMRTLAENTDGIAVLNINDLDKGFERISNDMSSVLPAGLLRLEYDSRRPLSQYYGPSEATRHPGSGSEGLPRTERERHQTSGRDYDWGRRARSGARSARTAHPDSAGHTVPRGRCRRSGSRAVVVGSRRASGDFTA